MTNAQTIEWLQEMGFRVRIAHERPIAGVSVQRGVDGRMILVGNELGEPVLCNRFLLDKDWGGRRHTQRGGVTYVRIFRGENRDAMVETSALCSMKDNYNKRLGVAIALGRALAVLKATDAVQAPVA